MIGASFLYDKRVRIYDYDQRPMTILGTVNGVATSVQGDPKGPIFLYDVLTDEGRQYSGLPANRLAVVSL